MSKFHVRRRSDTVSSSSPRSSSAPSSPLQIQSKKCGTVAVAQHDVLEQREPSIPRGRYLEEIDKEDDSGGKEEKMKTSYVFVGGTLPPLPPPPPVRVPASFFASSN